MSIFQLRNETSLDKTKNRVKYFDRFISHQISGFKLDRLQNEWLESIKTNGYCVIDNLFTEEFISKMANDVDARMRNQEFEIPCIGHNLVNLENPDHKAVVENFFLGSRENLKKLGLTFGQEETSRMSYEEIIGKFHPSTLKLYIPKKEQDYFNIWLNESILQVIEAYMGIKPYCVEAYIRRNFPSPYKVMNHYWHRDYNNPFHILKVFILFTDIKAENGPHEFVRGSHKNFGLNGKEYYSESEVDSFVKNSKLEVIRSEFKRGAIIIEDTRGLHRAALPTQGYRDLGYSIFTPLTFLSKRRVKYFDYDLNALDGLSDYQKSFLC